LLKKYKTSFLLREGYVKGNRQGSPSRLNHADFILTAGEEKRMLVSLFTACAAFIGTNIDDLLINMLFFSKVCDKKAVRRIWYGKYLGIIFLTLLSYLISCGMTFFIGKYVFLLGLVPLIMGIRKAVPLFFKSTEKEDGSDAATVCKTGLWSVFLITAANGADNVGVYVPFFSGLNYVEIIGTVLVFLAMTGLWCFLGRRLSNLSKIRTVFLRYGPYIESSIYIGLGVSILLSVFSHS